MWLLRFPSSPLCRSRSPDLARLRSGDRASPLCRSRSPDLDLSTKLLTRLRSGDRKLQALIGLSIDIKVLTDLEKRRNALFYRHLGPNGPKEVQPLHPEPLFKRATTIKPAAHFAGSEQHPKSNPSSRSVRTCMSIARRTEKNPKVR